MSHYLDTSALVKLVAREAETHALESWIASIGTPLVTSDLARTELMRAVRRTGHERAGRARLVLQSLVVLSLTPDVFDDAARLDPDSLRSLDAVHLAAALRLGDELESIVTYDERMAAVADGYGIPVVAPR